MIDQLILGDAVENAARLPAGSIAQTVTSPPYDNLYGLGTHFDFEPLAQQLWRVTAPGGVVCWNVQDRVIDGFETGTSSEQRLFFREIGFDLHQTIIVTPIPPRPFTGAGRYPNGFNYVFVFSKGVPRSFTALRDRRNQAPGEKQVRIHDDRRLLPATRLRNRSLRRSVVSEEFGYRSNVWQYSVSVTQDSFTREHPGRMAEALARDLILSYSNVGDLVLDPMNGVGTTTKMALLNHRCYLGFEIDPRWHEIAQRRMTEAEIEYQRRTDDWLGRLA